MGQTLKIVLVVTLGLLLAVWLGLGVGESNYHTVVLVSLFVFLGLLWFGLGEMFWPVTIASSFLGGTFPILRGSFTPFQILMAIGVTKFLVEEIIFRRRIMARTKRLDLILLLGFMAILTFHACKDRFGMRFLGSGVWGGRNYINVYVGMAAFFIIQSVTVKSKAWAKLPYLMLGVTGFDLLIAVITTLFPSSIYKIYPFYSAVSVAGIEEIISGESLTGRIGSFGNFGFILVILVLASLPLRKILTLSKLTPMVLLCGGWVAVLFSGFRSAVFNTMIATVLAGIRDLRWGILAFLPMLAALLFSLSILNTEVIHLPRQIQRGLTFLPGKWDTQMELNATASNEFRKQLWTVFVYEYFPAHPWFGRGFGFRKQLAADDSFLKYNPNWDRDAVEVGNVHNGFLATLDVFGVVGTIFFVAWNLRLLVRTLFVGFRTDAPSAMALRFVALSLGVSVLSYWIGALNVGSFLPQEFALAGVFLRLQRTVTSEAGDQPTQAVTQQAVPTQLAPI
jgi:hypothetical protein